MTNPLQPIDGKVTLRNRDIPVTERFLWSMIAEKNPAYFETEEGREWLESHSPESDYIKGYFLAGRAAE